jgi:hypothetical protein
MPRALLPLLVLVLSSSCASSRVATELPPASPTAPARVLRAVADFKPVKDPAFAASYAETRGADPATHGLAVNPKLVQDRFAAAEAVFEGPTGRYLIRLNAVAEEDGESIYELVVDGRSLGRRTNPRSTEPRRPAAHTWEAVPVKTGERLRILFAGRSNGLIPEDGASAWSRGRWRSVELISLP